MSELTKYQLEKVKRDWETYSSEKVEVEQIGDIIYGFTTELGARRIYDKYRWKPEEARVGCSQTGKGWYFEKKLNWG